MKEQRKSWINLIIALIPPLASIPLSVVAYFAAFMFTFSASKVKQDISFDEWGVNVPIFTLIRNLLFLILFGYWYIMVFIKEDGSDIFDSLKKRITSIKKPLFLPALIPAGYILQFLITHLMRFLTGTFPELMKDYNANVGSLIEGNVSILVVITVTFISPVAEEIIFRGLTQKYAEKAIGALPAIFFQAALFGIYHMNLIQGIVAVLFGILFGFMAGKSRSLIPSIILHAVFNFAAYLIP